MFNWLSLFIGLGYIVLGIVVIIYKFLFVALDPKVSLALGILLIVYGVFRIVRGFYRLKDAREDDKE